MTYEINININDYGLSSSDGLFISKEILKDNINYLSSHVVVVLRQIRVH